MTRTYYIYTSKAYSFITIYLINYVQIIAKICLKRVWNSFETLCNLQDFEFYAHKLLLSSNQCYEWLINKLYFQFVTFGTDLVKYSCWKRCFIRKVKVSVWHILWFVFIHNKYMNIFHVAISSRRCWYLFHCNWYSFFRKKVFWKRSLKVKFNVTV